MKIAVVIALVSGISCGSTTGRPDHEWRCGEGAVADPCVDEYCCLAERCLKTCGAPDLGLAACDDCRSAAKSGPCRDPLAACLAQWGAQQ